MNIIKFLVMDVDGTLTDGMIYMGNSGEQFKAFNIKDGCGIKDILPSYDIVPVIITARSSEILSQRCAELGIKEVFQNCRNKLNKLYEIIETYSISVNYDLSNVAYIGDDIMDLPCMRKICEHGGFVAAPSDAIPDVCKIANYVSGLKAGQGAVRDIIERIVNISSGTESISEYRSRIDKALDYIRNLNKERLEIGKYIVDKWFYYMVQEYELRDVSDCRFESHNSHVDIQWVLEGNEMMELCEDTELYDFRETYEEKTDTTLYGKEGQSNRREIIELYEGSYIIIPERRAHKGCIRCKNGSKSVKKIVAKVRVE